MQTGGNILPVVMHIDVVKEKEQKNDIEEQNRKQLQTPEEGNAPHEAHQQRRISHRCETASHIGYEEDKENHDVASFSPPGIHFDDRTNHQHGRTGGSDAAGQERTDDQKADIDPGRTGEIAFKGDISGDTVESKEQNDEGQIIIDEGLRLHIGSLRYAEGGSK